VRRTGVAALLVLAATAIVLVFPHEPGGRETRATREARYPAAAQTPAAPAPSKAKAVAAVPAAAAFTPEDVGPGERRDQRKRALVRARELVDSYVALYRSRPPVDEVASAERGIDDALSALAPAEILDLLRRTRAPIARAVVLRHVDRALEHDRHSWETALVLAVEAAGDDPSALREAAALAEPRVRDEERARQLAGYLEKRAAPRPR
jgi:hypothetical protein